MDRALTPHRLLNPDSLPKPSGFSHAVAAAGGRAVYVAGQTAQQADATMGGRTLAEQFDVAAGNVVKALASAGARPEHLVSMQIFTTDLAEYRASLQELGTAYRRHFGRHYPAIALLEVKGLFDPEARVELQCVAVVPE